jgi:hypothetical protein
LHETPKPKIFFCENLPNFRIFQKKIDKLYDFISYCLFSKISKIVFFFLNFFFKKSGNRKIFQNFSTKSEIVWYSVTRCSNRRKIFFEIVGRFPVSVSSVVSQIFYRIWGFNFCRFLYLQSSYFLNFLLTFRRNKTSLSTYPYLTSWGSLQPWGPSGDLCNMNPFDNRTNSRHLLFEDTCAPCRKSNLAGFAWYFLP